MNTTEIERCLTAAILINSDLLEPCLNRGVRPAMFADKFLGQVWAAVVPHKGVHYDLISLTAEHPDLNLENLIDLQSYIGSTAALDEWLRIFLESVRDRRIGESLDRAYQALTSPGADAVGIMNGLIAAGAEAMKLTETREETTLLDLGKEALQELSDLKRDAIPWFEPETEGRDKILMKKRQIVTLGAQSGAGKTEFSLGAVVKPALEAGKRVLYICTESPAFEIYSRLAGMMSAHGTPYRWLNAVERKIGMDDIQDWTDSATRTMPERFQGRLIIRGSDEFINTTAAIDLELQRVTSKHGQVDLLVVDFLQDLRGTPGMPADRPIVAIEYNVDELKRLTDKYGCATLINSQLNRTMSGKSERPTIYRLLGAGRIEHKSHIVCFLWKTDERRYELFSEKTRGIEPFSIPLKFSRRGYVSQPLNKIDHRYDPDDIEI